jgi:hypothetical protein
LWARLDFCTVYRVSVFLSSSFLHLFYFSFTLRISEEFPNFNSVFTKHESLWSSIIWSE